MGWRWLALLYTCVAAAGVAVGVWRTPYAISETVAILVTLDSFNLASAFALDGPYFRPAYWLGLDAVWRLSPSVVGAINTYKVLHVASVVLLIALFAAAARVRSGTDWAAYAVALPALVGVGGFRDNLENLPLNQTLIVMVLALVAVHLLRRPWRPWHVAAAFALAVVAPLVKEQGLAVAAILAAGALGGAPGLGRRSGLLIGALAAGYLVARALLQLAEGPAFLQEIGLGFEMLSASDANARFGGWPWAVYGYNVAATAGHILFGEPTDGAFKITKAIAEGRAMPWQWIQFGALTATTAVIAWWMARVVRGRTNDEGDRWLAWVFVAALAVSAGLGFNYTRNRFDGVAVVVYALVAFAAFRAWLTEALSRVEPRRFVIAAAGLLVLVTAWQLRVAGTAYYQRETAWQNRKEWIIDYYERERSYRHSHETHLRLMNDLRAQGRDPAVPNQPLPRWVHGVMGFQW
jgi:hypothetical protein